MHMVLARYLLRCSDNVFVSERGNSNWCKHIVRMGGRPQKWLQTDYRVFSYKPPTFDMSNIYQIHQVGLPRSTCMCADV